MTGAAGRLLAAGAAALAAACASPGAPPGPPAGDRLIEQASSAGRLAYEQGRAAQAVALYRQALERARAIDAAGPAADAAYNLALAQIAAGDLDAAAPLLRQAEYDAARAAAPAHDIRLVRAKLAHLQGRPAQALALADGVIAGASPRLALQARVLRGQVRADAGEAAAARGELHLAWEHAAAQPPGPSIEADLRKLEGSIALLAGDADAAARAFDAEAALLREARRHHDMARAYARAGAAHLAAARPAEAAARYFLAARSLAAQGDAAAGRAYAAASLDAAGRAGDDAARARARALQAELSARGDP